MKLAVVFPSVMYREGPAGVKKLIQGIESIGFHELDMFDHVVMGYPSESRPKPIYPAKMPIMEAFMMLSYAAAATTNIGLGTSVLVLSQRHPTLVAKQVSTLDTLSGGRMRLGVGVGWQESEYEALGETFSNRGRRIDEAIQILRACWRDEHINFDGTHYQIDEVAMEPKPPQGGAIPIWIGGTKSAALKRVARYGDGWMGMNAPKDKPLEERIKELHGYAESFDRDPSTIGMQMALSPGPTQKEHRKRFFADPQLILERLVELKELGFDEATIDCVPIFQHGFRTSDALLEHLNDIYQTVQHEL